MESYQKNIDQTLRFSENEIYDRAIKRFSRNDNCYFFSMHEICLITGLTHKCIEEAIDNRFVPSVIDKLDNDTEKWRKSSVLTIIESVDHMSELEVNVG